MIAKYYGKNIPLSILRDLSQTTKQGTSLRGLSSAAEGIGFRTLPGKLDFNQLADQAPLPCIAYWNQNHFLVIYKVKKDKVYVADPAYGYLQYEKQDFIAQWIGKGASWQSTGVVLLLEPTAEFEKYEEEKIHNKRDFSFIFKYLLGYRKYILQLLLGVIASSIIALILPFLTAAIVDTGIQYRDYGFIYLILVSQLFLFVGKTSIEILRAWILLHISARINISLLSDFFIKLMRLPIAFFDSRLKGDLIQRIKDHQKIETFLTSTSLSTIFSLFNLVTFSIILCYFSQEIFILFFTGSMIYVIWILLFLKKREALNYKMFSQQSLEQDKVIELLEGMQEIKLSNSERQMRWSWENLQAKLFKIEIKLLSLDQLQTVGANLINELKNILISFLAVTLVMNGDMTLGMMLAISYIIGQLNYPLLELIGFIHSAQDAKIAFARLSQIHTMENEPLDINKSIIIPDDDIHITNLCFKYAGAADYLIKDFTLVLPKNKVTAIVGASGSGKTTLMKLLLGYYEPASGEILVGNQHLKNISPVVWRNCCGVVMQEGYIFNDTIAGNIALGEDEVDKEKLLHSVEVANIKTFIDSLPLGFNTKLGTSGGLNISTGEKQRILIARAVYKNPAFIFFDEATSALDATNEKEIMDQAGMFFKKRTAIIIAHRLSTVRKADQIIVIDKGKIAEVGHHQSLIEEKGIYYTLIKNQLETEKLT